MASVLFKNSLGGSAYRGLFSETTFIRPPQDVDGICPAQACAQNVRQLMPFVAAPTELGTVIGGVFYANYPFAPDFTCPTATDVFQYEINGWDHYGNPIQELGTKNGSKQLAGTGLARVQRDLVDLCDVDDCWAGQHRSWHVVPCVGSQPCIPQVSSAVCPRQVDLCRQGGHGRCWRSNGAVDTHQSVAKSGNQRSRRSA